VARAQHDLAGAPLTLVLLHLLALIEAPPQVLVLLLRLPLL
jgi:hypothetical protein